MCHAHFQFHFPPPTPIQEPHVTISKNDKLMFKYISSRRQFPLIRIYPTDCRFPFQGDVWQHDKCTASSHSLSPEHVLQHHHRTSSFPSRTLVENVGVLISLDLESDVTDMSVPILPYWVRTTNM